MDSSILSIGQHLMSLPLTPPPSRASLGIGHERQLLAFLVPGRHGGEVPVQSAGAWRSTGCLGAPEEEKLPYTSKASCWISDIYRVSFRVSLLIPWLAKRKRKKEMISWCGLFFTGNFPHAGAGRERPVRKWVYLHSESPGEGSRVLSCFIDTQEHHLSEITT